MTTAQAGASSSVNTSFSAKTVLLQLMVGQLGTRSKVEASEISAALAEGSEKGDIAEDVLHISKDILESKELKQVNRAACAIRDFVRARALPSPLRGGTYVIPVAGVPELEQGLEDLITAWKRNVAIFMTAYRDEGPEGLKAQARTRLSKLGLWDEGDYPNSTRVERAFYIDVRYFSFEAPAKLKDISRGLFKREQAKIAAAWESAEEQGRLLQRAAMKDLLDHMLDRLTPTPDAKTGEMKKKVFRDSLVGNLNEFLGTFSAKNTCLDDVELEKIVAKMRGALKGIDVEVLRKDEDIRKHLSAKVKEAKALLDPLVVDKPSRLIRFNAANGHGAPAEAEG